MKLHTLAVLWSVCWCMFAVQRVESKELLPAPTLSFNPRVNQSAILLYSDISLQCTIPNNVRMPVEIHLTHAENANYSSSIQSRTTWSLRVVDFEFQMKPDNETAFICWYRHIRSEGWSNFSASLNVIIAGLSDPLMFLIPPAFPVGVKYIAQCETPTKGYENTTLKLYDRLLPIRPGKEAFEYIGLRVLLPGDWGASVYRTNAGETYEFICEMEVFVNGRALRSRSKILTAMPEELPVRLIPQNSDSGSCYGYAFLRVRDDWRPLCFSSTLQNTAEVAKVICRELGCGSVLDHKMLSTKSPDTIGTPNCTGNEKKIAECPLVSYDCNQGTLSVICSASLSPPKLSLSERGADSLAYIRTEESVTFRCIFESPVDHSAYIVFTHNGVESYTISARSGYAERWSLSETVPEGEYACFVRMQGSTVYRTERSNVISIYIYDPPPAGAVAGGVITTFFGVLILILLCVYGRSS
ncbi:hypothetical protein KOW79_009511 [Hemibagrus wyckioides]|uniref:SRCR domain-containing protein n=1 Tax=Hemibagrus wyckioides TaxID=337641 RepID=A0A9D3NPQ6_9TELE|nr:uncharacterized protein si:dkey-195m11.11 [Hemibagrus wyckioides]KAG7326110.1 hypothetical protein KOW79_009511 [Hemibagrus wyckioides]